MSVSVALIWPWLITIPDYFAAPPRLLSLLRKHCVTAASPAKYFLLLLFPKSSDQQCLLFLGGEGVHGPWLKAKGELLKLVLSFPFYFMLEKWTQYPGFQGKHFYLLSHFAAPLVPQLSNVLHACWCRLWARLGKVSFWPCLHALACFSLSLSFKQA